MVFLDHATVEDGHDREAAAELGRFVLTISPARTLGMDTVAEGIETEGRADLMRRLACDLGQGYFWSRPLEVDALGAWLSRQRPLALAA